MLVWVIEENNRWASEYSVVPFFELDVLESPEGVRRWIAKSLGYPSLDDPKALVAFVANAAPFFRTLGSMGDFAPLWGRDTRSSLKNFYGHLPPATRRELDQKIAERITKKAGEVAQNTDRVRLCHYQLYDAFSWILSAHNEWARANASAPVFPPAVLEELESFEQTLRCLRALRPPKEP